MQNSHVCMCKIHMYSCMSLCTNSKRKEKFVCKISEIRARILNKKRNLCTNLNNPTRLHQDRHSKTLSFGNYMVSLKSKSIKIILKSQGWTGIPTDRDQQN